MLSNILSWLLDALGTKDKIQPPPQKRAGVPYTKLLRARQRKQRS